MTEPSQGAFLVAATGPQTTRYPLESGEVWYLGRGEQNTIVLADNQVSRRHAMLQRTQTGEYYLIDLGSRNGTFLNQRRITAPAALRPGDRINIGSCEFLFSGPCGSSQDKASGPRDTVVDFAQRLITVLVADIRDFTGLSRRLGETGVSQLISAFFQNCGTILQQHGVWTQKYIGDAVMAVWVHQNDALELGDLVKVLDAAAKLFGVAARLQSQFSLDERIRIGAGINSGLACLGNVGSDAASDYTALSDAVNLAFRLESATKEIGRDLAMGRKTYEFLASQGIDGGLFESHLLMLKGYQEPKPVYSANESSLTTLLEDLRCRLSGDLSRTAIHSPGVLGGR